MSSTVLPLGLWWQACLKQYKAMRCWLTGRNWTLAEHNLTVSSHAADCLLRNKAKNIVIKTAHALFPLEIFGLLWDATANLGMVETHQKWKIWLMWKWSGCCTLWSDFNQQLCLLFALNFSSISTWYYLTESQSLCHNILCSCTWNFT